MRSLLIAGGLAAALVTGTMAWAAGPRDDILAALATQAKAEQPGFTGFDAARGKTFFQSAHSGGKPDTPSCTTCHGMDPRQPGQTRAGKSIEPMAVSQQPARFTDQEKIDKWFERNCSSVLGRACTAVEKGDFITYLSQQ